MMAKPTSPARRAWTAKDRSKVSVLHVFRSAHFAHDARIASDKNKNGETPITQRSQQRRIGLNEDTLKAHLQADLNSLMNTIRLDATVSLEDAPYVAKSIANYGFRDLSEVSLQELNSPSFVASIRESLLNHEPRLIGNSVNIRVENGSGDSRQRLAIYVSAEVMGDPVDIPVNFDAEIDLGAGKLRMSNLRVNS